LIAGFASTVGWPLSAFLDAQFGWRAACLIWAALHIAIGLPLNLLLIPRAPPPVRTSQVEGEVSPAPRGAMAILAFVFATTWFVTGAMAAHLPRLLEIAGASTTTAIAAAALVGPAQVAARLVEFGALRMVHPLVSARLAALLHPIGAVILGLVGPGAITAFAVLHGAGNGLLTIAKGTVPLAIFGPVGYGLRSGILGAPARATQAASPLLFGLLMDRMGVGVLAVSAGLSLSAFVALLLLKARPAAAPWRHSRRADARNSTITRKQSSPRRRGANQRLRVARPALWATFLVQEARSKLWLPLPAGLEIETHHLRQRSRDRNIVAAAPARQASPQLPKLTIQAVICDVPPN
jgi:hypothetical protein